MNTAPAFDLHGFCVHANLQEEFVIEAIATLLERYPDLQGVFAVRCQDMSSSLLGQTWLVGYGPSNTFQDVPDGIVMPTGLPSSSSTVTAVLRRAGHVFHQPSP